MNKLSNELKDIKEENRKIKLEMADYQIKEMKENAIKVNKLNVVKKIYNDGDLKYLTKIAEKITLDDNMVVLFAIKFEDKVNWFLLVRKILKVYQWMYC